MAVRLDIPPCDTRAVLALERGLGCPGPVAQVLVRRGLADVDAARAWLAADAAHDPLSLPGAAGAVPVVLGHVRAGSPITVHGDYDVDGVSSTAILVRCLRALGATVDWLLPSRLEDGYGLQAATVDRLAARGTRLLITVDCGVTAVAEVAAARAAGMEVVVTDHHQPRADGALPDAPIVHPGLGGPAATGYPCPELCAAGVAHKLSLALTVAWEGPVAEGYDPLDDLDLVALATVADCVPLVDENRRLVREGLAALARTRKPGLRALMRVARVDPGALDAGAIGFRLGPRINAAGRIARADAALELLLTPDEARAEEVAGELDALNVDRRFTEQRIAFAAEAQVAALGAQPAYVLWGEDWHPGVIGIVASRLAERHHRPFLLVALDGATGTGSGRSIPAFDLLGGLDACAEHLLRHGGHRAAAGCTVDREALEPLRAAFAAHAAAVLGPEDLVGVERVDAVVAGDELGLDLAEALGRLAPFGMGNPVPSLLIPAATLTDPRPLGEEAKHLRFTVQAGGARARAVAFRRTTLPSEAAVDATFTLELNEWGGAVEPRLVLREAQPSAPAPIAVVGEPTDWAAAVRAELDAPLAPWGPATEPPLAAVPGARSPEEAGASPPAGSPAASPKGSPATHPVGPADALHPHPAGTRAVRDRRGGGAAGTIAALVASGEPVLVVCADVRARLRGFEGRLGGFALASWRGLEREPDLTAAYDHVVLLDPPAHPALRAIATRGAPDALAHLAWGPEELGFAGHVHEHQHALRDPLAGAYRALRDGPGELEAALAAAAGGRLPDPVVAARLVRVLDELGLVELDREALRARVMSNVGRRDLDDSPTQRACAARREEGERWLSRGPARRAA